MGNLLLQTSKQYPPRGSLQEQVLLLVVARREKIEMSKAQLQAQAAHAPSRIKESWDAFVKEAYPWTLVAAQRQAEEARKILEDARPMYIRPLPDLKTAIARSRLYAQRQRHSK